MMAYNEIMNQCLNCNTKPNIFKPYEYQAVLKLECTLLKDSLWFEGLPVVKFLALLYAISQGHWYNANMKL